MGDPPPRAAAAIHDAGGLVLRHLKTFCGPNPWSEEPAVLAALEIKPEALEQASDRCARIAEICAAWFTPPEIAADAPDRGLNVARFLANWALSLLNSSGGYLHTGRGFLAGEETRICVGYHDERLTVAAMTMAAALFVQIDTVTAAMVEDRVSAFRQVAAKGHPDPQVRFIMEAAGTAGIPYFSFFREHRLWQFGWGKNANLFFESEPKQDSAIGWKVARDKSAAKAVFASLGVPLTPHVLARSEADLPEAARVIGWPCVVKPTASGRSQGVTTDIDSMEKLTSAFRRARSLDKGHVMVERQAEGEMHRIVVARGKTAWIIRREAPRVVGDGRRTVRELIGAANEATAERRARLPGTGPIPIDDELHTQLSRQNLTLDGIAPAGVTVLLRRIPLPETGALYTEVTEEAHPDVLALAEMLSASLGLAFCGLDFISRDIARSCAEEGVVLEINTTPGLRSAQIGGLDVGRIGRLALGESAGRIPVTLVLASATQLAGLPGLMEFAADDAWVISGTCGLGPLLLSGRDADGTAPPRTAALVQRMLRNPLASALTILCTPEELAEEGLPIDRYDAVFAAPVTIGADWLEVLRGAAGRWTNVEAVTEISALLADGE